MHQPVKWAFSNQNFCAPLVTSYFSQSNCTWPISSLCFWWIYWWFSWTLSSNWRASSLLCPVGRSVSSFSSSLLGSCHNFELQFFTNEEFLALEAVCVGISEKQPHFQKMPCPNWLIIMLVVLNTCQSFWGSCLWANLIQ